jgi:hypothetical protein
MSKHDKLLKRFLNRPKDFTYNELKALLNGLGYVEFCKGATSGSRVSFLHSMNKHIICLHKPHPANILKSYQVDLIIDELKSKGVIK